MGKKPKSRVRKLKYNYRPQDPFARPSQQDVNEGSNRPPRDDDDVIDIPRMSVGAAMIPGASLGEDPQRHRERGGDTGRKSKGPKHKRRMASATVEEERTRNADKPRPLPEEVAAPKQRPGESARAFARRVDAWTEQRLKVTRSKASTEHMREKKRQRAQAKRAKAAEKRNRVQTEDDGLYKNAAKASFGDVVHRPPILSDAAMKSRSKLKKGGTTPSGAGTSGASSSASELEAYAAKVREAYAAIKKRRLSGQ